MPLSYTSLLSSNFNGRASRVRNGSTRRPFLGFHLAKASSTLLLTHNVLCSIKLIVSAKRTFALAELLLVLPGALFMAALFLRNIQPAFYEPAQSARRLVDWYAARPFLALDVFLIALPFVALILGSAIVLRTWLSDAGFRRAAVDALAIVRTHFATLLIAVATLAAAGILAVVTLHMITE